MPGDPAQPIYINASANMCEIFTANPSLVISLTGTIQNGLWNARCAVDCGTQFPRGTALFLVNSFERRNHSKLHFPKILT